jgi:hypothetical protein
MMQQSLLALAAICLLSSDVSGFAFVPSRTNHVITTTQYGLVAKSRPRQASSLQMVDRK